MARARRVLVHQDAGAARLGAQDHALALDDVARLVAPECESTQGLREVLHSVQAEVGGPDAILVDVREESELSDDFRVALTLARFARFGRTADGEFSQIAAEARDLLGSVQKAQTSYAIDVILLAEERLESLKD